MFAGIVEAKAQLLDFAPENLDAASPLRIKIKKPINFNDIAAGDSIAVNGICLTVEACTTEFLQFCLGGETLTVLGWSNLTASTLAPALANFASRPINLERSLKLSDRIHGHLVSGHIDSMGTVSHLDDQAGCRDLHVVVEGSLLPLIWQKGSITLNGVSLTVNDVKSIEGPSAAIRVSLIPETLKRTNLADLKVGDRVTVEVDQMARGLMRLFEHREGLHI